MKHPGRRGIVTATSPKQERTLAQESRRQQRRESIESFVVVIVAFLVWSFEAEGFVIPTGSMAPTLMGRHKEIVCPECGNVYTVNADCEVDSSGSGASTGMRVAWGTCENCRFETRVDDAPSVAGDRIYTMKKGLDTAASCRRPGEVGPGPVGDRRLQAARGARGPLHQAPGRHARGDDPDPAGRPLATGPATEPRPFERLRRPIAHQQAMQVLVYDDSHRAASLQDDTRWRRWTPAIGGLDASRRRGRFACSSRRGTAGASCATATSCPIPSNGRRSGTARPLPVPPGRP